ncbi:hypothetical protein LTS12_027493, partial [Elasticomyces elasticus]
MLYTSTCLSPGTTHAAWLRIGTYGSQTDNKEHHLACRGLRGGNETLVIMRTGSTELEAKLPVHLATTLRCFPHKLLFSDAAEIYHGHNIIDALSSVSDELKEHHPDFELYRRLRKGRNVLEASELHDWRAEAVHESWTGHTDNPGWKLDKWKFMPMMKRTLHEYPVGIKWYVFVEADTYTLWPSLLDYLTTLDHTKPYYSGVEVYIANDPFAHGGSAFIISLPAMRLVVEYYDTHQREVEEFTDRHWAGDCILGKFLAKAGVALTSAWPVMQGDYPGIVPYIAFDGRPRPPTDVNIWCSQAVIYHHVDPSAVEELWRLEQQWVSGFRE